MNDAQSTIVGLKAQACPGGGWTGMPAELEGKATVADCLADGSCGCIYGGAAQHIERLHKGIVDYLHGDYPRTAKNSKCPHGRYGFEDCENCIDKYFEQLISPAPIAADDTNALKMLRE